MTKSNMVDFARCPYAFWLVDGGVVDAEAAVTRLQAAQMSAGVAFESRVAADAVAVPQNATFNDLLAGDADVLLDTRLVNRKLRLAGIPDGVRPGGGAVVPIEIKKRPRPTGRDALELAFYWLLLEPYRTRPVRPHGILFLEWRDQVVEVDVELTAGHFVEVRALVDGVRAARRDGVVPVGLCPCPVCKGPGRAALVADLVARRHVGLLWSVGPRFTEGLAALDLADFASLVAADPWEVAFRLRVGGCNVSAGMVARWQHHAVALLEQRPVTFAKGVPVGRRFIAVDLEYTPARVWLIAAAVVDGRRRGRVHQFWADDRAELKAALVALGELVAANPGLPVVTWSGNGADLPQLDRAADQAGARRAVRAVLERHVDAFALARDSVRLAVAGLGVKEVAAYFGFERTSGVRDGREATWLYGQYRRATSQRARASLRRELLAYSRKDVDMLITAVRGVDALLSGPGSST